MRKYKQVIHIIADLGNGGAERQLVELLKLNPNHKLLILKNAGIYKEYLDKLNVNYTELNCKNPFAVFLYFNKLSKIIKSSKAIIMHAWMYHACLLVSLLKILYNIKVKIVWGIRCSNMKLMYYSSRLKLIIFFSKLFSFTANVIVYNSYAGLKHHRTLGFSKKFDKVIYNGIDKNKFFFSNSKRHKFRKSLGITSKGLVFIFASRVDPMKNHSNLLIAFEKLKKKNKNVFLILIGKGTEKLKKQKGVFLLGMKLNLEEYYSSGDIVIIPSKFGEGFSNVLAEGMLCKLYPMATNIGDAKYIISDTGIIIKDPGSKEIEKSLNYVLKLTKKERLMQSERSRKRVLKKFSVKKMSLLYNNTYKEIL